MFARAPLRWSFALALVAHALAMALAPRAHSPVLDPNDPRSKPLEFEVAVEPPPPPLPIAPAPPPEPGATQPAVATVAPRVASHAGPAAEVGPPTDVPPVLTAEPSTGGAWTFSPTTTSAQAAGDFAAHDKAMNGATKAGVDAVLAEAQRKAEDRKRKPLLFTPQDLGLGLVPGNQYVSIARDRVRNSTTPLNGHALLEFWTDQRGIVARVRVLSASSDPRAWDELAETLAEDARSSVPLKVPSNADGFIVTLDVTSAMKRVSGGSADEGSLSRVLGAIQNPLDAVADAKTSPQRVVAARVVSVEAF